MSDQPHILVVDDDRRIRDLTARFLGEQGFNVVTANDAADARDKMKSLAFDLLVLDIMMPGETGLELTQSLRVESDVPILLLTARSETEDRIAGFERLFMEHVAPRRQSALPERIEQGGLIDQRAAAGVDQDRRLFHHRQLARTEEAARLGRQAQVQRHDVGIEQNLVLARHAGARRDDARRFAPRAPREHFHSQGFA